MNLMHIYAQDGPHDEAIIIANGEALQALLRAVGAARYAANHRGQCDVLTADGEHYSVVVVLKNDDWQSPAWQSLLMPYAAEIDKAALLK